MSKQLFTRKEAAFYLGVSENAFRRSLEPRLPYAWKSGGKKVFVKRDLDEIPRDQLPGRLADPEEAR